MTVAIGSAVLGLIIVIVAVTIPYWLTHRRMRPQHDPLETSAYAEATGRSTGQIAAGADGTTLRPRTPATRRWRAAQAGVHPDTGEPDPGTGRPDWPEGTR